jgi:hypothetical protein
MVTFLSVIFAAIALVMSAISIYFSIKVHRDSLNSTIITRAYGTFNEGIKMLLENSFLTHMFVMPKNYPEVKLLIQNSLGKLDVKQSSELILKERALALYAFQIFEHFHYQYKHSVDVKAKERIEFLSIILTYFTRRLLRNPRLLYYWNESGGNLSAYFELETIEYYNKEVTEKLDTDIEEIMDCDGPFQKK